MGAGWLHLRLTHKILRFPFFFDEYDSDDGARWKKPSTEKRGEVAARQRGGSPTHTLWVAHLQGASCRCPQEIFRVWSLSASATHIWERRPSRAFCVILGP